MEGISLMNHAKRVLLGFILLWAILLSACGPSSSNTLSAIYTAAAQTIAVQDALSAQSAVEQTATPMPTDAASILTPTNSGISTPTNLPTMAISLPTSASSGTACDGAIYISDVTIQDHTVENPGESFVKTWALQNTGSCTWSTGYTLTFVSGTQMGGTNTNVGSSVAPQQQTQISVTLTAPTTAGVYTGNWRLTNASGEAFGDTIDVVIDVNGSETDTPTLTDTPIDTPITETPAPTATNTPVTPAATTAVPTTAVPPTAVPTTAVPPTAIPPTAVPPTAVPPTATTAVVATPTK
jgi:hypothetical protein